MKIKEFCSMEYLRYKNFMKGLYLASLVFSSMAIIVLLLSPFLQFDEDASSQKALVRVMLALGFVTSIAHTHKFCKFRIDYAVFFSCIFFAYLLLHMYLYSYSLQEIRRLLTIVVFIYVAAIALENIKACRYIMATAVLTGSLCALFSICFQVANGVVTFIYREVGIHGSGVDGFGQFSNPIIAGMYYSFYLIVAFWLALTAQRRFTSVFWYVCAFVIFAYIYLTYARTAWLGSIVSMLILFFCVAPQHLKKLLVLGGCLLTWMVFWGSKVVAYELERGMTGRYEIWKVIIDRLSGHWMTGYGASEEFAHIVLANGVVVYSTHNVYLDIVYAFGLPGLILMLIFSGVCIIKLYKWRKNAQAALWLSVLVGAMVEMFFNRRPFIGVSNLIWILYWLPVSGCLATCWLEKMHVPQDNSDKLGKVCS